MIALTTASLLVLLALANGQFTPPNSAPGCNDPSVQSGGGYFAHQTYCQLYYQCDSGLNRYERSCAPGTVFHANISVCVRAEQAVCNNWRCDSSNILARYPALCCDQYLECGGSGFSLRNCSAGQVFNMATGQCGSGTCADHLQCYRPGNSNAAGYTCFDVPNADGNPCVYTTLDRGYNITNRPCGAGTAFNKDTCQCSTMNNNCPAAAPSSLNKALDPACRPSFNVDFNGFPIVATSEKIGSPNTLPYTFQTVGVSISNGQAILRPDPATGASPYIYNYFLNNNQLAAPVAFSVVFRVDSGAPNTQFALLTNNYNPNLCTPTLEVLVAYSGNTYQFTINAVGATSTSVNSETRISGSTQASINVGSGSFVEVIVTYNGAVSGVLIDRGNSGTSSGTTVNIPATNNLGAYLAANKCGFQWGRGLFGSIDRVRIYEGCGDFARVRV
ncbi:unnamed protein product [Lymnaea stagnalis]|uniref:Chitin-binding type-2 domain-containing protein n=1 Tax=Lymnaea stagnalis TaxID=6523 RepID=A0AAV2HNS0_LYMST